MTKQTKKIYKHETHFACDERMAKYGDKTVGCCCVGHSCKQNKKVEKLYTVSAQTFTSLRQAEEKIEKWIEDETFNQDSKVYVITEVYEPKIKLVKIKSKGGLV